LIDITVTICGQKKPKKWNMIILRLAYFAYEKIGVTLAVHKIAERVRVAAVEVGRGHK